jgi:predicted enzyme related to lactoylglutathione lyase
MSSALSWFEIPVQDLDRAHRFYSEVMQAELQQATIGGMAMAVFPYAEGGIGGAIIVGEQHVPSTQGTIVYLDAGDDLDGALARVEPAGGKVLMGRSLITEDIGSIAFIQDPEGNRVGLHSPH